MSDLEELRQWYAEQDVPDVGDRLVEEIFGRLEALRTHPDLGRVVPEFGQQFLRELIHPPFRIVYRRDAGSTMSWSITTEVSRSPLVGSAIDGLVHDRIQFHAQTVEIDARRAARRLGNHRSKHEPPLRNRAELGDRHPVSGDGDRLAGLHLAKYRARVVAELALGNGPFHGSENSIRSTP